MPCTGCRVKGDETNPAPNCCENIVVGDRADLIRSAAAILRADLDGRGVEGDRSSAFIMTHWHVSHYEEGTDLPVYQCDVFDPVTRQCTEHDTRPDVCRRYPAYGDDYWERVEWERYPRCGYVAEMLAEMALGG